MAKLRERRDIRELQREYDLGNRKPLETLVRAWKGIQDKSKVNKYDPDGFFIIAGYHGEPFRGAGWSNPQWWGGYCNHGNVLFPTWHRAYLLRLENALRKIPGCEDVTMAYWNEIDDETKEEGIPQIFLSKTFVLDGEKIDNPLHSYKFPGMVADNVQVLDQNNNPADYTKPKGYVTVRYPYSGLVGPNDKAKTKEHNDRVDALGDPDGMLNKNVKDWLNEGFKIGDKFKNTNTRQKFHDCLNAPNYTVFSNTSSAAQWNQDNNDTEHEVAPKLVIPIESPHNDIHLAIGGFDIPGVSNADQYAGANGDMGENDTASFDPIFFFHHCFIDKVFWTWQVYKNSTDKLEIIPEYPGTNSVDAQGPTPGVAGNIWLTTESPLNPFDITDSKTNTKRPMTSNDVINIEKQLEYTYLPTIRKPLKASPPVSNTDPHVRITGINRNAVPGSFILVVHVPHPTEPGQRQIVGTESVLSRWHTSGCANCQSSRQIKRFVHLPGVTEEHTNDVQVEVVGRLLAKDSLEKPAQQPTLEIGWMTNN